MKRHRIVIIVIGLLSLLLVSSLHAGQRSDLPDDLVFTTIDGKIFDSAALKARPLVLIIGATWCPECRREAPEVQKAYLEYGARGVMFLCVFGGSKDDDITDFLATYNIAFSAVRDNGIAERLGVRVIPQTLFYAKGGRFVKRIIGPASYRELVTNIDKIIGK